MLKHFIEAFKLSKIILTQKMSLYLCYFLELLKYDIIFSNKGKLKIDQTNI